MICSSPIGILYVSISLFFPFTFNCFTITSLLIKYPFGAFVSWIVIVPNGKILSSNNVSPLTLYSLEYLICPFLSVFKTQVLIGNFISAGFVS